MVEDKAIEWVEVPLVKPKQNIGNESSIIYNYNTFKIEVPKNIKRDDIAEVLDAIVSVC